MTSPQAPVGRVGGVVLAAGGSVRYGGEKLLEPLDGKPVLQHVIDAANASRLADVVVVLGHAAEGLLAKLRLGRARPILNHEWATGQASSLRAGVRAVADLDAVVVLLGDQPRITAALIDALVLRQRTSGTAAVISSWNGRRSPPTLLTSRLFSEIEALRGDVGAREILAGRHDVAEVEVTGALGSLVDVDRPEDLDGLR